MPGLFRLIFYFLIGYLIYKGYKILLHFLSGSGSKTDQKVYTTEKNRKKINREDIIEAQFEDIDVKEKPTEK